MSSTRPLLAKLLLLPASKVFALVAAVRNMMFNRGWLKQTEFDIPVVVVGNLAVGGTGKTPHVEHLVELLRRDNRIGVLSRGYKRATKGFVMGSRRSSPDDIGDESYQILTKYEPDISLAVCEKRVEGIRRMREVDPDISLLLLDDAFQHRYVKPSVAVVLTEYSRPLYEDRMLPYGRLREPMKALSRADAVVVTKCPPNMKPVEFRIFKERLNLAPWQKLFFSRYVYGHLVAVFPERVEQIPYLDWLKEEDSLLVVSGIANPRPFVRYLRRYKAKVRMLCFPDHHRFDAADIDAIARKFRTMSGTNKYIITTEKDAVRISHNPYFPHSLQPLTFYLPIGVEFIHRDPGEPTFEAEIKKMIRNNKPHS